MTKRSKYKRGDILECWHHHENGEHTSNYYIVQSRKCFLRTRHYARTDIDYYLIPVEGDWKAEPWDASFIDLAPFRLTETPLTYYGWRKVGCAYNASSI